MDLESEQKIFERIVKKWLRNIFKSKQFIIVSYQGIGNNFEIYLALVTIAKTKDQPQINVRVHVCKSGFSFTFSEIAYSCRHFGSQYGNPHSHSSMFIT